MIKLNEIALDYEPRKKFLPRLPEYVSPQGYGEPEMSEFESAFLCGLLKQFRPKKILEVGVAGGATTAIILQALEDIGEPYEMHSVDAAEKFYRDKTKSTGFMAMFAKENNLLYTPPQSTLNGEHKFHLGKYLPQVIDEIGGDIDFVILDTVHSLPGEILDFPVMLPYLKDGAIVVLHDLTYNYGVKPMHMLGYATPTLFAAVTAADKYLNDRKGSTDVFFTYPNIGAFKINEQTREHIDDLFLSLLITWAYVPDANQVKIYREFYEKHYPAELIKIFNEAVKLNSNDKLRNNRRLLAQIKELMPDAKTEFLRHRTSRVDIKLLSTEGDFQVINVSDDKATVQKPAWFQKDGMGYMIQSRAEKLEFVVKATVDSQIIVWLRGIDVRTPEDKSKRIPYWIDYTKLAVNGENIFDALTPAWHDKPYVYNMDAKAGEEIKIQLEWQPHNN